MIRVLLVIKTDTLLGFIFYSMAKYFHFISLNQMAISKYQEPQ